jgi:hypothetical protein
MRVERFSMRFLDPRVELFGGLIFGLKKWLFLMAKTAVKMTPKSVQKMRPKMRKNAQNGQNSAQTHWD